MMKKNSIISIATIFASLGLLSACDESSDGDAELSAEQDVRSASAEEEGSAESEEQDESDTKDSQDGMDVDSASEPMSEPKEEEQVSEPVVCAVGEYGANCEPCPAGKTCAGGDAAPVDCPAGKTCAGEPYKAYQVLPVGEVRPARPGGVRLRVPREVDGERKNEEEEEDEKGTGVHG